jgi:hypothetical protein
MNLVHLGARMNGRRLGRDLIRYSKTKEPKVGPHDEEA